ncbi:Cupin 2 conserved barrel domain protein [Pseudofrankia inefficax]|uniref:Cupin 2 conserved barrel domain protein n=2 Tax=Pseudofrankia inefficax (strain DSM 45817 / CECT 9037 / DDB 130130 / EuI1c) TaxID=298654 RepID=E3J939_PSEI1|nr:Cupin 2 conserved barrel domain protein [Pseudofrankia inefficax]
MEKLTDSTDDDAAWRGMTFYSAVTAKDLWAAGALTPQQVSDETAAATARLAEAGWPHTGAMTKVLVSQTAEEGGFQLHYVWFKPNWVLRRHHHPADCLYYVVSGTAHMGRRVLKAGDSFFVPSGVQYQYSAGPEGCEVLEIRRGSKIVDTVVAEHSPAQWDRMVETMRDNREAWEQLRLSPTFANRNDDVPVTHAVLGPDDAR